MLSRELGRGGTLLRASFWKSNQVHWETFVQNDNNDNHLVCQQILYHLHCPCTGFFISFTAICQFIYWIILVNEINWVPSSLWYKMHFSRQLNCWSLRCSWSIACRRCSNYIYILNLTPGFNRLGKYNHKRGWEEFKLCDLVRLILETLWYIGNEMKSIEIHVQWNLSNETGEVLPKQGSTLRVVRSSNPT